ncbi:hypothetical protein DFH27DRAFT_558180 [Peziza echinospora]|nr:hypothetical protein DFH27DRAFT_558180 [Peziza echinospora]
MDAESNTQMEAEPDKKRPKTASVISVDFDPNGDVVLVMEAEASEARFRVNSAFLIFVSPVLKAMFGPDSRFQEASRLEAARASKSSVPIDITMGEDDAFAWAVILWAIHQRPDRVPKKLDVQQLHKLAVICDKYDVKPRHLRLYLDLWIPPLVAEPNKLESPWLFISYVFGYKDTFRAVSRTLSFHGQPDTFNKSYMLDLQSHDAQGNRISGESTGIFTSSITPTSLDKYVPKPIGDALIVARSQTFDSVMAVVEELKGRYEQIFGRRCKAMDTLDEYQSHCDIVTSAFLQHSLKGIGLIGMDGKFMKLPWSGTMEALRKKLTAIDIPYFYHGTCVDNHKVNCMYCKRQSTKNVQNQHGKNHRYTCSPIPQLKKDIEAIYEGAKGLNLDDFKQIESMDLPTMPHESGDTGDLWSYLVSK